MIQIATNFRFYIHYEQEKTLHSSMIFQMFALIMLNFTWFLALEKRSS